LAIEFLKLRDPYGCFSNFWRCSIIWGGQVWPSSEHLYQALKYEGTDNTFSQLIRKAQTPRDAADLGRRGRNIRPDWDNIRVAIMEQVVLEKFVQNEDLRRVLHATGNEEIREVFPGERFWSYADGRGRNELGKVLMRVRDKTYGMPYTQLTLI